MKKRLYFYLLMICMALSGCGNAKEEPDIEVEEETAEDSNTSEEDEIPEDETDFSYADLRGIEFGFGSGVGAWCTTMTIGEDGSFEGELVLCQDLVQIKMRIFSGYLSVFHSSQPVSIASA